MSDAGSPVPCLELKRILEPALLPCRHFAGPCAGIALWDPPHGHVPRGFTGALRRLEDIDLVLVVAEPGDPLPGESHPSKGGPQAIMADVAGYAYEQIAKPTNLFHRNLRKILDSCWPGMPLIHQMARTWLAESYLCSARTEGGAVPAVSARVCARDYLKPQVELLHDRAIVACGAKAQHRMGLTGVGFLSVGSVAPPGCNLQRVRQSWKKIPAFVSAKREARLTGQVNANSWH